jgi:hypothetical protein
MVALELPPPPKTVTYRLYTVCYYTLLLLDTHHCFDTVTHTVRLLPHTVRLLPHCSTVRLLPHCQTVTTPLHGDHTALSPHCYTVTILLSHCYNSYTAATTPLHAVAAHRPTRRDHTVATHRNPTRRDHTVATHRNSTPSHCTRLHSVTIVTQSRRSTAPPSLKEPLKS